MMMKGLSSFLRLPLSAKLLVLRRKLKQKTGLSIPILIRLPDAGWWIAYSDYRGDTIWHFEKGERRFVWRFLRPGMTVLDIGAHVGLYSLIAAKRVGPDGVVIAFEPSPREYRRLRLHLWLNRIRNVRTEPIAVSDEDGETTFWIVEGWSTGGNSLRNPVHFGEPTKPIQVPTTRLDTYLNQRNLKKVDFIKMDVEGSELQILRGAHELLTRIPRPVMMLEMTDYPVRGYPCVTLYDFLADTYGYQWYSVSIDGDLFPCPRKSEFHENLVAVPEERTPEVQEHLALRTAL